jgi:hypothetical protein
MHKRLIIIFCLLFGPLVAEVSVVELPLRLEFEYSKRVPGNIEFYYITRLPSHGEVIAIPESELARFINLAKENGFTEAQLGDYDYLPTNQQAVGATAVATVTIEHTDQLRFWINPDGYWITWDDDHPAPIPTLNGVEIVDWSLAQIPMSPSPLVPHR